MVSISTIQDTILHYSLSPGFYGLWPALRLVFYDLGSFGPYWLGILWNAPQLETDAFPKITRVLGLGEKTTELKFSCHPVIKGVYCEHNTTVDVDLLTEVVCPGFFTVKVSFFPFPCRLWRKSLSTTGIQGGRYVPPPWGLNIYIKHLEYFCMGNLSTVLTYFYPIICLYQYGLMVIYFMIWVI